MYGFDYDYTLASYKKGVEYLIHDIAKEHLGNITNNHYNITLV